VHVDAVGSFLKLVIHKNHVNKHNLYNQVRGVLYNQVRGVLYNQVRGVLYNQVRGVLYNQVRGVLQFALGQYSGISLFCLSLDRYSALLRTWVGIPVV